MLGDPVDRNPDAPLVGLEYVGEPLAPRVEDGADAGQPQALEPGVVGQVGDRLVVEIDHLGDVEHGAVDRLVAAELAIGRLQAVELEPAERLDAGRRPYLKSALIVRSGLPDGRMMGAPRPSMPRR